MTRSRARGGELEGEGVGDELGEPVVALRRKLGRNFDIGLPRFEDLVEREEETVIGSPVSRTGKRPPGLERLRARLGRELLANGDRKDEMNLVRNDPVVPWAGLPDTEVLLELFSFPLTTLLKTEGLLLPVEERPSISKLLPLLLALNASRSGTPRARWLKAELELDVASPPTSNTSGEEAIPRGRRPDVFRSSKGGPRETGWYRMTVGGGA